MKKVLGNNIMMFAAMAAMLDPSLNENIHREKKRPLIPLRSAIPFNKKEGVIKTIADYKLIALGESKKGKLKQSRTISKINEWIEDGYLTDSDLI